MGGFYKEPGDPVLRFGDVLRGYVLGAARQPHARSGSDRSAQDSEFECLLDVRVPKYCVLLTPCCAIGMSHHYSKDRMLTVAPLVKVHGYWFSNPNWSENLLKVNTPMRRDLQMPPKDFDLLAEEKKDELRHTLRHPLAEYFVYAEHDLLDPYTVRTPSGDLTTRQYAVNFLDTYHLVCADIISREKFPETTKLLQLTARERETLRFKLASWYLRRPDEDNDEDPVYFASLVS